MTIEEHGSSSRRIFTIAATDVRMRVARGSSAVVLVALCMFAYMVVPDLSTGRALMQVNGHRALYNSATIALATSSLCAVLLGLAGFYLISNTVRRDVESRTGYVIASTPVRNVEYLVGKLLGSAAFLALVVVVYVLNVMAMQLLRGEAPVEPLTYLAMFLAIVGPVVIVVAGIALMFECVRPLSGRIGDILYFFLWAFLLSVPAATAIGSKPGAASNFDVFGMAFIINAANDQVANDFHAHPEVSIGSSRFDATRSPWRFKGVTWTAPVIVSRITSALLVVPALLIAWLRFARFDPARMKGGAAGSRTSVRGRMAAPLRRMLGVLRPASWGGPGLVRATLGEIALTIMLRPIVFLAVVAAAIAGVLVPAATLRTALIPIVFVALVATLAEIPTRDRVARVDGIRNGIAGLRASSAFAKLLAALGITVAFLVMPLLRLAISAPADALSLLIGGWLFAAAGVGLGTLSRTPKLFAGVAPLFLYVVMSSAHAPEFDFAGWNGAADNGVRAAYFLTAMIFAALAVLGDWRTMRAER
jgi:ABC-type transport system involved in multi-copper enzyme maturation permease subunit